METSEANKEYIRFKLAQAGESYEEAKGLLADGAELSYVVNSLYYAFYYPVLALLRAKGVPSAMQSVSIALFDREFVQTGFFEKRFSDAVHRAFNLKPKCSGETPAVITRDEVEALLAEARDFLDAVRQKAGVS